MEEKDVHEFVERKNSNAQTATPIPVSVESLDVDNSKASGHSSGHTKNVSSNVHRNSKNKNKNSSSSSSNSSHTNSKNNRRGGGGGEEEGEEEDDFFATPGEDNEGSGGHIWPAVDVWYECSDEQGHVYYYNENTKQSEWVAPEWVEETDEQSGAR